MSAPGIWLNTECINLHLFIFDYTLEVRYVPEMFGYNDNYLLLAEIT
jgi:hypothetical protein